MKQWATMEGVMGALRLLRDSLDARIAAATSIAETALEATRNSVAKQEPAVENGYQARMPEVMVWSHASWERGAAVTHLGGTWIAKCATTEEPGTGGDWRCIVSGIHDIRIEPAGNLRQFRLSLITSDKQEIAREFTIQVPVHTGKWMPDKAYAFNDEVAWAGATWRAAVENSDVEPGRSEHWLLVAKQGKKGDRGEDGRNGEKGEKGDRGEKGEKGEKGDRGEDGRNGEKGEKGDRGEKGEKGEKGYRGEKGEKGENGENGYRGEDGNNGEKGEKGEKGERGPAGLIGEWQGSFRSGHLYKHGAVVSHNYCLWLAMEDTDKIPGSSGSGWDMVLSAPTRGAA